MKAIKITGFSSQRACEKNVRRFPVRREYAKTCNVYQMLGSLWRLFNKTTGEYWMPFRICRKISLLMLTVCIFFPGQTAMAAKDNNRKIALRYLEASIEQCEKGLQFSVPRSRMSLNVLKRYQKKYQRSRRLALQIDPTLDEYNASYTGIIFPEKPTNRFLTLVK